jgi:hypothetical protein
VRACLEFHSQFYRHFQWSVDLLPSVYQEDYFSSSPLLLESADLSPANPDRYTLYLQSESIMLEPLYYVGIEDPADLHFNEEIHNQYFNNFFNFLLPGSLKESLYNCTEFIRYLQHHAMSRSLYNNEP